MTATPLTDVARRLKANVQAETCDRSEAVLKVPVAAYLDRDRWEAEVEQVFRRSPIAVAFSCDIAEPGDRYAFEIAGRPVVVMRGQDGVARTFLNACRHRGAAVACDGFAHGRRLTCPYHAWVYDNEGALVGVAGRETFGEIDVTGLVEYPTHERAGVVFAVLTEGLDFDVDEWLGDMASALELLELDKMHRYDVDTVLESGSWKITADGYLDGYHLGYLHRNSIGGKSITNRNTYDLYGPHVRLGFANKPIAATGDTPVEEWVLTDVMSLVHYIFPNISISGQPGRSLMVSRILPGPTVDRSWVSQYHYVREPIADDATRAALEAKRVEYAQVTYEEDFLTVMGLNRSLAGMADGVIRFGRNETGNQNLHRWVDALVDGAMR